MKKITLALIPVYVVLGLAACNRGSGPSQPTSPTSNETKTATPTQTGTSNTPDAMSAELTKLAGSGATDCGRIGMSGDVQTASHCAMEANTAKKPFYVRYDLPMPDAQMAIGTVRTTDGKLMSVQYDSKSWEK